jgi:hypothetical protein
MLQRIKWYRITGKLVGYLLVLQVYNLQKSTKTTSFLYGVQAVFPYLRHTNF